MERKNRGHTVLRLKKRYIYGALIIFIVVIIFSSLGIFHKQLANSYYQRGVSAFQKNKYQEAEANFSKAIKLNPKIPDYYGYEAASLNNIGKKDKIIKVLDDGVKNNPDSNLLKNQLNRMNKELTKPEL